MHLKTNKQKINNNLNPKFSPPKTTDTANNLSSPKRFLHSFQILYVCSCVCEFRPQYFLDCFPVSTIQKDGLFLGGPATVTARSQLGIILSSSLAFSWALVAMTGTWVQSVCVEAGSSHKPFLTCLRRRSGQYRLSSKGPNSANRLLFEMQWSRKLYERHLLSSGATVLCTTEIPAREEEMLEMFCQEAKTSPAALLTTLNHNSDP